MSTKIQIPNPCTEDWNQMTPTDKGAFCDMCAFEVIDFTEKSPEEIRETLKMRSGQRTCGHISKTQMELANSNYHLWENQTPRIFRSKFLYACLIVFGVGLFSGCSSAGDDHDVGEVDYQENYDVGMVEEDTTSCDVVVDGMMETLGEFEPLENGEMIEGEMIEEDTE